jgi:hypothetical protein
MGVKNVRYESSSTLYFTNFRFANFPSYQFSFLLFCKTFPNFASVDIHRFNILALFGICKEGRDNKAGTTRGQPERATNTPKPMGVDQRLFWPLFLWVVYVFLSTF